MRTTLLLFSLLVAATACDRRPKKGEGPYARRVREAMPRIEEATGLKFKTPPKLEVRSRAQVREFLLAKFNEAQPSEQLRGEETAYKLFGLIPDTMQMRPFLLDLLTEQIVGYYDPQTKLLYVVQEAPEDMAGVLVSHELVHALQDQYVNLDSIQKATDNTDRQAAAQAVLEGQATYVQVKSALGGADLATRLPGGWDQMREVIRQNQSSMPLFALAPMAIQESLLFPYLSGAEFMRRFERHKGGKSPLDSLPVSTEQILDERAYFMERDDPSEVRLPPAAPGTVLHEQVMGEFGTRLFIYQHLKNNTTAIAAARGWDGDRYRVVRTPKGNALVWAILWDSPVDAAQFGDAVSEATGRRYRTSAPVVNSRTGVRTYSGAGRTVVIAPQEIGGRTIVVITDVPSGVSPTLIDPARITIGR
jgi:hypothetical protein